MYVYLQIVSQKNNNNNKEGILRINNNINLQCDKDDDNCKKIYQNLFILLII